MNYYKRHLGDYAKDTGHLSPLEHGVYTLLLDRYYSTERPIHDADANRVARAKSAAERQAVAAILGEFFKCVGHEWHHSYADRVIAEASEKAKKNRENGKRGGRPVTQTEPKQNPEITQSVPSGLSEITLSTTPLATSHKPKENEPPDGGMGDPKELIWKTGVSLLVKHGEKEAPARTFLGQFAKNGAETKLAEVIGYLAANPKIEPKAYIVAAMTRKSGLDQFLEAGNA